jgi:hypothetical protein
MKAAAGLPESGPRGLSSGTPHGRRGCRMHKVINV